MATDNKYDRQLRLWGANGQKALSESCIVLINATACGTETLKNLVLPGIGQFHIIDDAIVPGTNGRSSNGNKKVVEPFSNFFVFPDGREEDQSRAEIATMHLSELNPDVNGNFTAVRSLEDADYASILSSIQSETVGNILVICADLPPPIVRKVSSLCWDGIDTDGGTSSAIPLLIVKSYGLIGQVRVQTPYHPIVESKPDNTVPDLRLAQVACGKGNFPELKELAASIDLASLDSQQHGHVPYVILLLKALEKWREESGDGSGPGTRLPKTLEEKNSFRQVIKSMARNLNNEVNFIEADENAYLAYSTQDIPWEVQGFIDGADKTIQDKIKAGSSTSNSSVASFDVLLLALNKFIAKHGAPPLNGSIPDMTSSTQSYIELQGLYKNKAERDKSEMREIIKGIAEQYGDGIPTILDDELSSFCKNIFNLRLIKTRSYVQEYDFEYNSEEKCDLLGDLASVAYDPYEVPEHTPLLWYIALRACDMFYDDNGHYPGNDSRELALENDAVTVQRHIETIVKKLDLSENDFFQSTLLSSDDDKKLVFAKEMTRYQNAEIHNTASIIGGIASQEAVKLITAQYVPMDGNYIFNGIASVAGVYKV